VQDVATGCGSDGVEGSQRRGKEICQILRQIQAPLSPLLLRLCHWMLPKLLSHLFLSVQLHRGQLEMVLQAARTVWSWPGAPKPWNARNSSEIPSLQPNVPLVFVCTHQSQLDGLLLSFLLRSQGIGVPRVTVGTWMSPRLRSLLQSLGGIFLPSGMAQTGSDRDEGLPGAVLDAYVQEVLRRHQPLVIFLEEPPGSLRLSAPARHWLLRVLRALRDRAVPDVLIVPVGIAYDVAP
ncbi:GPAT2 acyltransferase, partial [Smithornis capensis]|nr:GPAT2 acyltransferase [Smithornis capensis]